MAGIILPRRTSKRASTNLNIVEIKDYATLENEIKKYIKDRKALNKIKEAYLFAEKMHTDQKRKNGDPYIYHPLSTAYYLAQLQMGPKTIKAGLLHDVVEDTPVKIEEIEEKFGKEIASLVESVTKVSYFAEENREQIKSEYLRKLYISMAKDIRVIIIKIADRLHNMLTIENMSIEKQKIIAKETLTIYAAIAHRIGMKNAKSKLEDMAFKVLNPEEFENIEHLIEKGRESREINIAKTIDDISVFLRKEKHIKIIDIFGREKTIYSTYRKMSNGKHFEELHDLVAIRIIARSTDDCYKILGYLHQKYLPLSGRFKDYIATPKNNVYQSLHTTLSDNKGMFFEVQIRTQQMDDVAEAGAAAHWRYKEGEVVDVVKRQKQIDEQIDIFSRILDLTDQINEEENSSEAELEKQLQKDVFGSMIYVLTPSQSVITLPYGATVLDFAYRIHTEIGEKTSGAKIDGVFSPINTVLESGQVVEIKTSSKQQPTHEWLKIVTTSNAKNRIRKYLANKLKEDNSFDEDRKELAKKSENIINSYINQKELKWKRKSPAEILEGVKKSGFANLEEFLISVGKGEISIVEAADKYFINHNFSKDEEALRSIKSKTINDLSLKNDIVVDGITNIKTSIASCCMPIPYEDVIGYVTKSGNGIKVHLKECYNLYTTEENKRLVQVQWNSAVAENSLYTTKLKYFATDRPNLLYDVSRALSNLKATTMNVKLGVDDKSLLVNGELTIKVKSSAQLNQIILTIKSIPNVIDCERSVKSIK
ncbi:bifunctional (p)ppGpp synthetase/guanosine-3',5'-bis(diphosphate) 3'-pyrophosphohydrolase [Mesoplasma chauliocola]|uniref:Penta-phosphate guanosine-3'-pyrophosphohydrolase n=1 Tax=Mesoplasma chauliocola TaxID=216427 RepID=A0A249SMX1_9MOLU|nr:RelA/SpoT family protein [Mesoplasma chauliocola]ASZ09034.1 bifunctional (p)ppGpp synthetase/guanosine-3',5'-bis(diphosphate) 3'-pyrophosphohydrolase [Mesoplasma chauliocola]